MRTTIDIPDPLFRRMKSKAAMDGISLKMLLTQFVEQGLASRSRQPDRVRSARSSLPVIRSAGTGCSLPTLSNADIEALLDQGDAEGLGRE